MLSLIFPLFRSDFCSACVLCVAELSTVLPLSPSHFAKPKVEGISSVWVTDCPCGRVVRATLETWIDDRGASARSSADRPVLGDVRSCNARVAYALR